MKIDVISLSQHKIDTALAAAKVALPADASAVLEQVVGAYSTVLGELANKDTTIGRLRRMLFGASSEKLAKVLRRSGRTRRRQRRAPMAARSSPRAARRADTAATARTPTPVRGRSASRITSSSQAISARRAARGGSTNNGSGRRFWST